MTRFGALTAWCRYLLAAWWHGGPDYDLRIAYFASRRLLKGFRIVVSVCAFLLGAVSGALLLVESAGVHDVAIRVVGTGIGLFWCVRWMIGPVPLLRTAIAFVFSSSLSIFLVSTTDVDAMAGAFGISVLVLTATFAAFMFPLRIFALHAVLLVAAIAYFIAPLWAEYGAVLALVKTVMLLITVVGVPTAVQVGLVFLSQDASDSDTDQLCDVLNRRGFLRHSERALTWRQRGDLPSVGGALLVDVDAFKLVNDERGHAAGDATLIAIAETLEAAFPGFDPVVGRMGGDEFAVFVLDMPLQDLVREAERICRDVATGARLLDNGATISIGVCHEVLPRDEPASTVIDRLISRADCAMYEAKRSGGSVVLAAFPDRSPDPS